MELDRFVETHPPAIKGSPQSWAVHVSREQIVQRRHRGRPTWKHRHFPEKETNFSWISWKISTKNVRPDSYSTQFAGTNQQRQLRRCQGCRPRTQRSVRRYYDHTTSIKFSDQTDPLTLLSPMISICLIIFSVVVNGWRFLTRGVVRLRQRSRRWTQESWWRSRELEPRRPGSSLLQDQVDLLVKKISYLP